LHKEQLQTKQRRTITGPDGIHIHSGFRDPFLFVVWLIYKATLSVSTCK